MRSPAPPRSAFPWYLTSSSLWMAGISLQGFLFTWLLVGVLDTPAGDTAIARSLAEFPPLLVLLIGGLLGDRFDARAYLGVMHVLMAVPPLVIAIVHGSGALGYAWVVTFGILMASVQSLSDPARQSALSRVALLDAQRAVTVTTIVTSLVGVGAIYVGGSLEQLGLPLVLAIQSAFFLAGIYPVRRMPPLPMPDVRVNVRHGLQALWRAPPIRNLIGLNLLSSLFNAGAYVIAIPFIVKDVYSGDASMFAMVLIVFTIGSIGSNVLLLLWMPLERPGRLFLVMQLTRMVILGLLWLEPSLPVFYLCLFAWGLNMGTTTTMVRAIVQELAPPHARAQILSVLLLSFLVSSPLSALLLGVLIAETSPLDALLPGIAISLVIFALGVWRSGLWALRSTGAPLAIVSESHEAVRRE